MSQEIINQGAEAVIERRGNEVIKKRVEKSYRLKELDEKIRKLRTRSEAKMLERAAKIIPVPKVLKVDENSKEIVMEAIEGKRLSDSLDKFPIKKQKEICEIIGENIAKLHDASIIHGDLTPANMILVEDGNKMPASQIVDKKNTNKKTNDKLNSSSSSSLTMFRGRVGGEAINLRIFFIDFGLGFISAKPEDKAVDLHLLREALEAGFSSNWEILFNAVKKGYSKDYKDSKLILDRYKKVENRGRYKQGS